MPIGRHRKQELRQGALADVRREVLAERAAALARITRGLEDCLAQLEAMRARPPPTHPKSEPSA